MVRALMLDVPEALLAERRALGTIAVASSPPRRFEAATLDGAPSVRL